MKKATNVCFGLLALATVSAAAEPSTEAADEAVFTIGPAGAGDSHVIAEAGPAYLGLKGDGYKFGEYTGLVDDGAFAVGNVSAWKNSLWNSGDTDRWRLHGRDLGLDSRYLGFEFHRQGRFSFSASYDQIPHYLIEGALTPYIGKGSPSLTLPSIWPALPANGGTSDFPLATTNQTIDIENERQRYKFDYSRILSPAWSFEASYMHEDREGTKPTYAVFGVNGGNPAAVALASPVDQRVDEVGASLRLATDRYQLQFGYELSLFDNRHDALRWDNAFTGGRTSAGGWRNAPVNGGQMGLSPDSQAHQITVSGGYRLSPISRLSGSASYGVMLQDEDFLPYTITPLAGLVDLPRGSLDGEIRSTNLDLRLTTRPRPKLNLRAEYRYNDRDNRTPRGVYQVVPSDVGNQGTIDSGAARINRPYSFTEHEISLDAVYRLQGATQASLGYAYEQTDRDFQEVKQVMDHKVGAKLRGRPFDHTTAWVGLEQTWRDTDGYDPTTPFVTGFSPEHVAISSPLFDNHPEIRRFHLAEAEISELSAAGSVTPNAAMSFGFKGSYKRENFEESLGLNDRERSHLSLDATWVPIETLSTYAFYDFDLSDWDQRGHYFASFLPSLVNPAQRWSQAIEDRVHTLGTGATWQAIEDRLTFDLSYTYSDATTAFDTSGGAVLQPIEPLPDLTSVLHRLQFKADYELEKDLNLGLVYWFERLDTEDFAYDGLTQDSSEYLLSFGQKSPAYRAHVFAVTVKARF